MFFHFLPGSWPYFRETSFLEQSSAGWGVSKRKTSSNVLASKLINFILKDESWKNEIGGRDGESDNYHRVLNI